MSIIYPGLNVLGDVKILLNPPTKKLSDLGSMIFEIFKDPAENDSPEQAFL
jgi:hypothetical protein